MNLNPEQIDAIGTREGKFCCLATAGSGKTTVLVERVKALIFANQPLDQILALTFTTEAANNMGERLGMTMTKNERGGFRTFHSFGLKLVFAERHLLKWKLADNPFASGNGSRILRDVIKARFGRRLPKREMDELRNFISKAKRAGVKLPDTFEPEVLPQAEVGKWASLFRTYDEQMKAQGQLDYDDMIVEAVNLLENDSVRKRWQFKWVHCDEAQDTDNLQFRMLQLVSEQYGNIFVVGDANQSMYEFRGAHPENLSKFPEWFPGARILILPENFRSTQAIVKFSQKLAPIKNELTANMRTANEQGVPVEIVNYLGNDDEVDHILEEIQTLQGKSAILARTNQQVGLFETVCTANDIKFHLLGRSGFWKTPEIKNLVGLVQFLRSEEPAQTYPQQLVKPLRRVIRNIPAVDAVKQIIEYSKLRELYADEDYEEADNFAIGNLNGAVQIAQRFKDLQEFAEFANRAAHASRKSKKAITLGTIHSAKGLEWDNVYVVGASDGRIPHEKGDLHEERCIFYVAVSRPAKRLQVSYSGQRSRFLDELDEESEDGIPEREV